MVCSTPDYLSNGHFRSQFTFLFDSNANLIPNRIGRFSHFNEDFNTFTTAINLPPIELPLLNASKHKPFIAYYTPSMINAIKERYAIDFLLFNFTSEEDMAPILINDLISRINDSLKLNITQYKSKRLQILYNYLEKNTILKPKTFKQKITFSKNIIRSLWH